MAVSFVDTCTSAPEIGFAKALVGRQGWLDQTEECKAIGYGVACAKEGDMGLFFCFSQFPVDDYKLDFVFLLKGNPLVCLGVEVDGFQYHDRTPEQALRDRLKDRRLLRRGISVVRFTAHEIMFDAERCAYEALDTFKTVWERLR